MKRTLGALLGAVENPGGSMMPLTLDFAAGGESSWATQSGTAGS